MPGQRVLGKKIRLSTFGSEREAAAKFSPHPAFPVLQKLESLISLRLSDDTLTDQRLELNFEPLGSGVFHLLLKLIRNDAVILGDLLDILALRPSAFHSIYGDAEQSRLILKHRLLTGCNLIESQIISEEAMRPNDVGAQKTETDHRQKCVC